MKNQLDTFAAGEADNWYLRSRDILRSKESDKIVTEMEALRIIPKKYLEIGCSNGYRLQLMKNKFGGNAFGVEPSSLAILEGQQLFEEISLQVGTADALPFVEDSFDLVIFSFVLHWIDRPLLLKCCAEADRVLSDQGILVIHDFYPEQNIKVQYHHLPGQEIYTYKQDYPEIFLSSGLYKELYTQVQYYDTSEKIYETSLNKNRIKLTFLKKDISTGYPMVKY